MSRSYQRISRRYFGEMNLVTTNFLGGWGFPLVVPLTGKRFLDKWTTSSFSLACPSELTGARCNLLEDKRFLMSTGKRSREQSKSCTLRLQTCRNYPCETEDMKISWDLAGDLNTWAVFHLSLAPAALLAELRLLTNGWLLDHTGEIPGIVLH